MCRKERQHLTCRHAVSLCVCLSEHQIKVSLALRARDDIHSTRNMTSVSGFSLLSSSRSLAGDVLLAAVLAFGCHAALDPPPTSCICIIKSEAVGL